MDKLTSLEHVYYLFIFKLRPQLRQVTYTPDETQLFWSQEKTQIPPIGAPCQEENGADSWISGPNLYPNPNPWS